jgi:hypothetical protein
MRPAEHRRHSHDLTALVDLVSHGCEEVGISRKQRVRVGHHAVLPDEGMGPVEAGVQGTSHHLALVVDAGSDGGKISRQSAEVCDCAVPPKSGIEGCAVRASDIPNNLTPVVNAEGETTSSKVRKGKAVPFFSTIRREALRCRFPSSLRLGLDR